MKIGLGIQDYREVIECFVEMIQQELKDSLVSVVLYGSVAREEASPQSDIDLLVIQDRASPHYYERLEPIISAEKKLRNTEAYQEFEKNRWSPYFCYLIYSKEEANKNRHIYLDMTEHSVVLFDRDDFFRERLQELKARLKTLRARKVALENGTWYWDLKPDLVAGEVFEL